MVQVGQLMWLGIANLALMTSHDCEHDGHLVLVRLQVPLRPYKIRLVCKVRHGTNASPVRHTCECVCSAGNGDQEILEDVLAVPISVEGLGPISDGHLPSLTAPPEDVCLCYLACMYCN